VKEAAALNSSVKSSAKMKRDFRKEVDGSGLAWNSFKKLLPDWSDTAFESMSGVLELKTFLSRNAGLRFGKDGELVTKELPAACFKTNKATSAGQVLAARSLATACARLVSKATNTSYLNFSGSADSLRESILRSTNDSWITLPLLLDACWSHGVPVLYLPALPVQGRKMEGMVTYVQGRPAIILTKKVPHPDWLLFILAHEMGHIACDHLLEEEGEAVVDETVDVGEFGSRDQQEVEANHFATHLLAPSGKEVTIGGRFPNAAQLAVRATAFARENGMPPGYVILNAVHNSLINGKKPFALGQAALKRLATPNNQPVEDLCREALRRHVTKDKLRDDSIDFLDKLSLL
jgi:hypothetical protein